MASELSSLVLEISRHADQLRMSIYEPSQAPQTVMHYSQCAVSFETVDRLCRDITFLLNKSRAKTEPGLINDLKKTGQLLWDQLLTRSVKDRLKITIIKDLVLSLEEELVNIPWELLYDGSDFLCLNFNVGRLVRTKHQQSAVQYRSVSGKLKMLILANPTDDLKAAYQEGMNIKRQFDRTRQSLSIDFKSTNIDTLYVKKNLRDYDICHYAGHCDYDRDNPKNTGWVLSDARFTAEDILTMGQTMPLPVLIFSNACHSAEVAKDAIDTDYQEKTYSMASAFLFSGVRHYIGAVQKIEDPASFSFAKEFYSQLLKGRSVGESVRLARLGIKNEFGEGSVLWSNYILYGDPNFVLLKQRVKQTALAPTKKTALYSRHKKRILPVLTASAVVLFLIGVYFVLPSLNPKTYYLFLKSEKLFNKGRNEEAFAILKRVLDKEPKFFSAYPLVADTLSRLGKRDEALKYYFDYALYTQEKKNPGQLAFAYTMIGWIYHQQGEYPKAFEFYDKAITVSRKNNDRLNEATAMRKLAVWYMDKEEYDKALQLLTKSSEINRQQLKSRRHRYNLACDYFDLGLLFVNKDDLETGRDFYDKSLKLFSKMDLKNEMSDYYFNLGEIYLMEKDYQNTLQNYMKGLSIDLAQDNKPSISSDYNMIGELYVEIDDPKKAEEFFKKAEAQAKQIDAQPELASACYNLGMLYKNDNKKNKAREYLRKAEEFYRRIDTPEYKQVQQELLSLDAS